MLVASSDKVVNLYTYHEDSIELKARYKTTQSKSAILLQAKLSKDWREHANILTMTGGS